MILRTISRVVGVCCIFLLLPNSEATAADKKMPLRAYRPAPNPPLAKEKALQRAILGINPQELKQEQHYLGMLEVVPGSPLFVNGRTVTTTPLLGLKSAFNATDLLYQYPSMNEDLVLLQQRFYFQHYLKRVGNSLNNRPIVIISGGVEGQIIYNDDFVNLPSSDVNLSTAELDISALVSETANALISFDYDSSSPVTGNRVENSRIFLSRAFVTLGNLEASPVYFTIGQMYPPFGKYSSVMLTTPLTKSLARILDRAALLGVVEHNFYAEGYLFSGNKTSGSFQFPKQGGLNAGYQTDYTDIGMGWVTNIADSQGMQNNGLPSSTQFEGFAQSGTNNLAHSVAGLDTHFSWNAGPVSLIAEYITALRRFAPQDLLFNNKGAMVRVVQFELDIPMTFCNKSMILGLIYGETWQALPLNLPKNSYAVVINASIWKDTMVGLEYRRDINYSVMANSSVSGSGLPVSSVNVGGIRNLITLQFGAYF